MFWRQAVLGRCTEGAARHNLCKIQFEHRDNCFISYNHFAYIYRTGAAGRGGDYTYHLTGFVLCQPCGC